MRDPRIQSGSGSLTVRELTSRERVRWDGYVLGLSRGSPYHLFAWIEAAKRAYRLEHAALIAERGSTIKGVLPLALIRPPWGRGSAVSLPYCDFAGAGADDPGTAKLLLEHALEWAVSRRASLLEVRAPEPLPGFDEDAFRLESRVRLLLELPGSSDALMSGFRSKLRSQIRKPQRDGLTAQTGGEELLQEFYEVFRRNMRDLGSPAHSREWFQALLQEYGDRMRICLVRMPDDRPAAGGVMLCTDHSVTVPWASSLRELNRWNPNMLLYWTMLAFAADGGWELFDFGRSTPGEGTWKFKRQWGAEPAPLYWARFRVGQGGLTPLPQEEQSGPGRGRVLAESIIRKLPVPVATFLGSRIRRYISL
jgi:FemAB-related protein (PEP-CTERM system-associated)